MSGFLAMVRRDLAREWRSGSYWLPVVFFLLVATLYPFAVGPDAPLLARTGGGILWIALLLAALLPIDRLFSPDRDSGLLDQMALRGVADESIAAAKAVAHSVGFGVPMLVAVLPAAALLNIPADVLPRLIGGLVIGVIALSSLSVIIAAVMLGSRATSALSGLLMLPLAVPVLIFGAGTLDGNARGAILFLAAAALLLVAIMPFAAGAALRAARES